MRRLKVLALIFLTGVTFGQTEKSSIAVANPHIQGLSITSEVAAKFIQLELIKLDKFFVYDEFDIEEIIEGNERFKDGCFGINCLVEMGQLLKVDNIISGSIDGLGNKIAISLKWIDVNSGKLYKSVVREFDNQEDEVQRMIEILLKEMQGVPIDKELVDRIKFKNDLITSNNVGKINNSGPRIGYAYLVGTMNEFARRPRSEGGLEIFPAVSLTGYQFEGQYVGTENFSALIEGIINFSGLEQGVFIPSITILNGFRFGNAGWEFAFGPGFGLKRVSSGFFDTENAFGRGSNSYFSVSDWMEFCYDNYGTDPAYIDQNGSFTYPTPEEVSGQPYTYSDHADTRGVTKLNTTWVFAFGRTFRAGSLNIPMNVFYSSHRGGGYAGLSVGFNVLNKKKKMNRR